MVRCRACLTSENSLNPIDLQFVESFNLLTGIRISIIDSLYACKLCWDTMRSFLEFREKCIEADLRFQNSLVSVQEIKENVSPIEDNDYLETEIKQEVKFEFLTTNGEIFNEDDDCSEIEHDEIRKSKSTKRRKRSPDKKIKKVISKSRKLGEVKETDIENKEVVTNYESKIHCGLCEERFDERLELNKHLEYHKSLFDTQISCGLCTERFVNLPHMLGHRMDHVPYEQKKCHLCLKKFHASSATCLEFHYMRVHSMAEKDAPIQCKQCPSSYVTSRKLIRHVRNCHAAPRYECPTCGKGFRNTTLLKLHIRMMHSEVEAMKCEHCDFTTKYANSLTLHIVRKHTSNTLRCGACCRVFRDAAALRRHVAGVCRHHDRVVCSVCGRTVKNIWLKHHMRSHSDDYPFQCTQCPAKYKYRSGLKDHRTKHEGALSHHCELCAKSFALRAALVSHLKSHAPGKPHVCKICNASFKRRYNLKVHMQAHSFPAPSQKHGEIV